MRPKSTNQRSKLQQLRYKKLQLKSEISYMTRQNFKSESLKRTCGKQKQEIQLKSDIKQFEFKNQKQNITSPVDGYVDKLFTHTIGGVVTPAEKLYPLPLQCASFNQSNSFKRRYRFVKEKLPAQIKVDTFSFQKYGLLKGIVNNVAK